MKVENEQLLQAFREKKRCEICGEPATVPLHPHHIYARGMGGAARLDVSINLLAVCPADHTAIHLGSLTIKDRKATRRDLLDFVARREGTTIEAIEAELFRLLRQAPDSGERRPKARKKKPPRCACGASKPRKAARCVKCWRAANEQRRA